MVATHVMVDRSTLNEPRMCGITTLTMLASMMEMNAADTTASVIIARLKGEG